MPHNTISVCAARTNPFYCSIHEHIIELERRIEDGETFDNAKLTRIAERHFDGTRAEGRYSLRQAYDALEIAVHNYLLENHARKLMQMDFRDGLSSVLRPLLERLPERSDLMLGNAELQQLTISPTIAFLVARLLDPKESDLVLEPSAGTGGLAIWPHAMGARVICNETDVRRNSLLRCVFNFDTFPLEPEFINELLPAQIQPTAVLMHPSPGPMSCRATKWNSMYEARHVASALRRLQDGGRLVAIVSEGMSFSDLRVIEWWRRIACLCNIRANLTLDGEAYSRYVAAPKIHILVVDKTGPTPGTGWHHRLSQISCRHAATIEQAWKSLKHLVEPNKPPEDSEIPNVNLVEQSGTDATDIERTQLALNFR